MSTYTVQRVKHAELVANTVDTVTLGTGVGEQVEVRNRSSSIELYFTIDGTTPTVGGNDCFMVPGGSAMPINSRRLSSGPIATVKLISGGAIPYTVTATP